MARVGNIGARIELMPMDVHFHEISIGLYEAPDENGKPAFRVHTYSSREGAKERVAAVANAMRVLGGLEESPSGLLRFPCGEEHVLACKRLFIEACKLDPNTPLSAPSLFIHDKKSDSRITAVSLGAGAYQIEPEADDETMSRRAAATANGLTKLAAMRARDGGENRVAFDCGCAHDALVGLLLARAINVRAALREAEAAASRGVLAAPSAQQS